MQDRQKERRGGLLSASAPAGMASGGGGGGKPLSKSSSGCVFRTTLAARSTSELDSRLLGRRPELHLHHIVVVHNGSSLTRRVGSRAVRKSTKLRKKEAEIAHLQKEELVKTMEIRRLELEQKELDIAELQQQVESLRASTGGGAAKKAALLESA